MKPITVINCMSFDRSDPQEIVCLDPKTKTSTTRLQALQADNTSYGRRDIGMVNYYVGAHTNKNWKQHCVYANPDGSINWGQHADMFDAATKTEIRAIAKAILATSKIHPEFQFYLQGY